MKYLVTGGTGFIGGALVRKLIEKEDEVTCLVRPSSKFNLHELGTPVTLNPDYSKYDIVYHIAGQMGKKGLPYETYKEPAVFLTAKILKDMSKGQRFVYMSSQNVILKNTPNGYLKYYRDTKREGEEIVNRMAKEREIEYRIIRPGVTYGRGDYHNLGLFKFIKRLGTLFPIVGSGKNKMGFTYIDDVTRATINSFEFEEEIIPVAGERIMMKDVFRLIARALGVGEPKFHIPAIKVEPFRDWLKMDFFTCDFLFTSIVETIPLEEGLAKCINWYKEAM